ncbi:MAG: hypothetical protein JHC33_08955 [Ignisphaera sp.]|nr:hypothetical protein [Ignisphaera sp.]
MAISITTDLVDVNLSEATTNYAVLGTWGTAIAASPDTYVQASNTVGGRVSAAEAWAHTTNSGATTMNLTTGVHVFQWLKCISVPQLDTKANGGLGITISSDATPTLTGTTPSNGPTNSKTWYVGGNADALSGWVCYVVDPQSTPTLTLGSPTISAINRIGIRAKISGTVGGGSVKPVNIVFDATRYGTGLTYTGDTSGTPGAFTDILTTAMSPANAWGILTFDSSIYFGAGKLNFGTTGQTAVSSFKDVNQLFVWRNFPVAATFYAWNILGAASFATTFQIGNYSGGLTSGGCTVKGAGDTSGSTFATWSITAGTNTNVSLYGSNFSEVYRTTLQSNSVVRSCVFGNFGNITANGALFDGCTFLNLRTTAPISATYGIVVATTAATITNSTFINCAPAIFWNVATDTNGKLDGTKFISGGTGYAMELGPNCPASITLTNNIFTGYGTTGTTNACIYNNSGKAITIYVSGGTAPSYNNGSGATTSVVTSTVNFTLTGIPTGSHIALLDNDNSNAVLQEDTNTSSSTFTYTYTYPGTDKNVSVNIVNQSWGVVYVSGQKLLSTNQSFPIAFNTDRVYKAN